MIQLDIEVPDRPGELGKLAAILGAAKINIEAISGESAGGRSYVSLIVMPPVPDREGLRTADKEWVFLFEPNRARRATRGQARGARGSREEARRRRGRRGERDSP